MVTASMHMYYVIIFVNEWMRASASADVIIVASRFSESIEVLTNITWNGPSRGAGEREIFETFRKKTFLPCVHGCSTPCIQDSLDERQIPIISLFSLL